MEYRNCHNTHFHIAVLEKRGKEIARSHNRVGSRSRGSGWDDQTIHAERAVVKALGDVSQLRDCVLIVVRLNRHNEVLPSKPCHNCHMFLEKCIRKYGLRKVMYS